MFKKVNLTRKFSLLMSGLVLASACVQIQYAQAADRVTKPEHDWAEDGKVDFCAEANTFDYRNAYWMGALSTYSYWHLKYIDKLYKAPAGTAVAINFEREDKKAEDNKTENNKNENSKTENNATPETSIFRGLGFGTLRSTYFSSSVLKPESGHKYPNLVRRWFPPLPGEACVKPEMYFCYGPAVANTEASPALIAQCGEHNEKAFMEVKRLQRIQDLVNGKKLSKKERSQALSDRVHIESMVKKYEAVKHVDVGLNNWQDENLSQRCEQYKFKDDLVPDTQGAVYENENAITIVFRGTEAGNTNDIMTDLMAINKVDLSKNSKATGSVHEGFYKAARILRDWVLQEINEIRRLRPESINKPIFITGHSLGGAVAHMVMYNLLEYNERAKNKEDFQALNLKALYTFGSPRVGDEVWATQFKTLADKMKVGLYRMVNLNDLVPRVPCIDYAHVGTLVYMDGSRESEELTQHVVNVLANPIDSLLGPASLHSSFSACGITSALKRPWAIEAMINDHFMTSYYSNLAKIRSELNEKFKSEEVRARASGNLEAVKQLQYPLNCKLNSSTTNLDGILKLNYQMLNSEVEESALIY